MCLVGTSEKEAPTMPPDVVYTPKGEADWNENIQNVEKSISCVSDYLVEQCVLRISGSTERLCKSGGCYSHTHESESTYLCIRA